MQLITDQIRNFLQYVAVQFIEHPERAQLKVAELGPNRLRFKIILERSDVALLIGRNGFSASAIRRAVAGRGVERPASVMQIVVGATPASSGSPANTFLAPHRRNQALIMCAPLMVISGLSQIW